MSIIDKLSEIFKSSHKYYSKIELLKMLKIHGEKELEEFEESLNKLVINGEVYHDNKKGYRVFSNDLGLAFGIIEINKNGNGYVHTNDGYTIFISFENLNGALNQDRVIVGDIENGRKNDYCGSIKRIVKREIGTALFEVIRVDNTISFVPYNNNYNISISLNKNDIAKLVDGDIIEVSVSPTEEMGVFPAYLNRVVGNKMDPETDIKALAAEFQIDDRFSDEELKQADNIPTSVSEKDKEGRRDLTDIPFVTIDCDNTKDRDDAVYVKKLPNGNYKLYVSIASVNYYIKRGTPLFEGIKKRCTSHYPNNTVIPMLPHKISNGICSLNEGEVRLTKTCEMEIDSNGNVVDYDIYNSYIRSRKAMSYSDVNKIFSGEVVGGYEDYLDMLQEMRELNAILTSANKKREYLEFYVPEIEVSKENGENIFYLNEQKEAKKIIENFMVTTNSTVASHFSWIPFIYRIHEAPNEVIINNVIKKMNLCGYKVKIDGKITRGSLNALLKKFKTKEECQIFHQMLLKAMAKARYSTNNEGHYALKISDYCHFTSPIRRAADFMIHTAIDELEENNYASEYVDMLEKELAEVSRLASKEEINDFKFEEEAKKMAMAESMEGHIGEEYEGIITEIYPHGVFVRTNGLIEGKVALQDIGDEKERFMFDQERYVVACKKSKIAYHVGDRVLVEAISASKPNRTINFKLERKKKDN